MRGKALGATMGAAALLAVMPTGAQARELSGNMHVTGGVTITWHGDPARGCEAAGLCGYSGSAEVSAGPGLSYYYLTIEGGKLYGESSRIDMTAPPEVRVKRAEDGVEAGTCTDRVTNAWFGLATRFAKPGRARFAVFNNDMTPARCAGPPQLYRAILRLPQRVVPLKHVAHGNTTIDLSGSAAYSSGRFSGTVTSTLKYHLGPDTQPNERMVAARQSRARAGARRPTRVVNLRAVYRIAGYRGEVSANFGGLTAPPCASLDMCGVRGSAHWVVRGTRGDVEIDADAKARRSDRGLRGAIRAIGRRNAIINAWAGVPDNVDGTTTAEVMRPGGVPCHDTARAASPGLDMNGIGSPLWIEVGGVDAYPSDGDLVRAGCPGPRDFDVFRSGAMAAGPLRISALGRRTVKVLLKGSGKFTGPGYSGTRSARFTLTLRRVVVRATYRRSRFAPFRVVAPRRP
jgi:hypothetical protein